jgi:hypothetical protein
MSGGKNGRAIARRRGRRLEYRVARFLGGIVWPGQDGDVEARGFRFECKYRQGWQLASSREMLDWLEQVQKYRERNPGTEFALVVWGGGRKFPPLVCLDIATFERLTRPDGTGSLRGFLERLYPDLKALVEALEREKQKTADWELEGGS